MSDSNEVILDIFLFIEMHAYIINEDVVFKSSCLQSKANKGSMNLALKGKKIYVIVTKPFFILFYLYITLICI